MFSTYKLQNCATKKTLPSLIHADRLKLCESGRFFSKYANDAQTTVTADTQNDDGIDNTSLLTDKINITDRSHILTSHNNGSETLMPPSTTDRGRIAASILTTATACETETAKQLQNTASKQTAKPRKHPVRVFTRFTYRPESDSARSQTAAITYAATTSITADRPSSGNSGERPPPHLPTSTIPSQPPPTYKQVVNGSDSSVENYSDWHEIIKILAHKKRGNHMFYQVRWKDKSKS